MIEFPCDFPIKIIYQNVPDAQEELLDIVHRHHPKLSQETIKMQDSGGGNFSSLTVVVHAIDQASLDLLYRELTQHPRIKMVL